MFSERSDELQFGLIESQFNFLFCGGHRFNIHTQAQVLNMHTHAHTNVCMYWGGLF